MKFSPHSSINMSVQCNNIFLILLNGASTRNKQNYRFKEMDLICFDLVTLG